MNFAGDDTFGLNLNASLGENHAVITAGNHHAIALNLTFDFGVFTENQSLLGDNISLHVPVNTERASHRQRPFHRDALIDESCPLFAVTVASRAGPLPSHEIPHSATSPL